MRRVLRYCQVVQFMAAIYIRKMKKRPSQYTWAHRIGFRTVVGKQYSHHYGRHGGGRSLWLNSRYAFLVSDEHIKELVVQNRKNSSCKIKVFISKIYPVMCAQPVAFIDELCAFNLLIRGSRPEDAFIELIRPVAKTDEVDACISLPTASEAHIALIITSFYDENMDYSDELREYFQAAKPVSLGDVIAIPWHKPWNEKIIDIFFKVVRFGEREEFTEAIIDSKKTTLYQDAALYDRIPYNNVTCHLPEKFYDLSKRISALILANLTMKSASPLIFLLSGLPGSGKKLFLRHLSSVVHLDIYFSNCYNIRNDVPGTYEKSIRSAFEKVGLKNSLAMMAFLNADLIGCDPNNDHGQNINFLILYHFEIPLLAEDDRKIIIMHEIGDENLVDISAVSRQTCGFTLSELHVLIGDALFRMKSTRAHSLKTDHFYWAIDVRSKNLASEIGAPIIPKVTWDDIGGLEDVKQMIVESLLLNLKGKKNMRRSGVLLYGPPGCGKTLIAKAVANQFKITFLSVKGPELLNKYIGQSEANVRKVFEKARMTAPCVVFFDELDSLASNRGRCGDSSRVTDNIVSQLTSELDCLEDSSIFVLGATNRPDLLDSSLLRSGRFDKIVEVGGTKDVVVRERVLRAASRNITFANDVNLSEIAQLCGHLSSGADLHAVISRAQMDAIRKRIIAVESGLASLDEQLLVTQENLRTAAREVTPSHGKNYGQLFGL